MVAEGGRDLGWAGPEGTGWIREVSGPQAGSHPARSSQGDPTDTQPHVHERECNGHAESLICGRLDERHACRDFILGKGGGDPAGEGGGGLKRQSCLKTQPATCPVSASATRGREVARSWVLRQDGWHAIPALPLMPDGRPCASVSPSLRKG